jgi:hypothetical protein
LYDSVDGTGCEQNRRTMDNKKCAENRKYKVFITRIRKHSTQVICWTPNGRCRRGRPKQKPTEVIKKLKKEILRKETGVINRLQTIKFHLMIIGLVRNLKLNSELLWINRVLYFSQDVT